MLTYFMKFKKSLKIRNRKHSKVVYRAIFAFYLFLRASYALSNRFAVVLSFI